MDQQRMLEQLTEARAELALNEEVHAHLVSVVRGLEGLLHLHGQGNMVAGARQPKLSDAEQAKPQRRNTPVKEGSFRQTVLRVIREAEGEPLHSTEILNRAQLLGATTGAKDKVKIVDLVIFSMVTSSHAPIEKTDKHTWRWIGPLESAQARSTPSNFTGGDASRHEEL